MRIFCLEIDCHEARYMYIYLMIDLEKIYLQRHFLSKLFEKINKFFILEGHICNFILKSLSNFHELGLHKKKNSDKKLNRNSEVCNFLFCNEISLFSKLSEKCSNICYSQNKFRPLFHHLNFYLQRLYTQD